MPRSGPNQCPMASIQKVAAGYRAQIKKLGVRDSRLFSTRREAVAWAGERETEIVGRATKPLSEQHRDLGPGLGTVRVRYSAPCSHRDTSSEEVGMFQKLVLAATLLAPGYALAQAVPNIPSSCDTQHAKQVETSTIQEIAYPNPGAPYIVHIQSVDNASERATHYGGKMLVCHVNVSWSNGRFDSGYRFAVWGGPTGAARASYGPEGIKY